MMNSGKLAGIRASASRDKRRLRRELSVDMISTPLGDLRHTTHVSRTGEVFGDASFLDSQSETWGENFFSRATLLRHGQRQNDVLVHGDRRGSLDLSRTQNSPNMKDTISLQELQTTPSTDVDSSSSTCSSSTLPHLDPVSDSDSFSDLLTSFTIDLGPSLVTEVLALIDVSRDHALNLQSGDDKEQGI